VPSEYVRILEGGKIYSAECVEGAEANRILQNVFGIDPYPADNPQRIKLKEYLDLVYSNNWKTDKAIELRKDLDKIYGEQEPELTAADLYIENEEWENEHNQENGEGACS